MRFHLKTKYADVPVTLEWGRYNNANAPWPEIALTFVHADSGAPVMRATRSLSAHELFPLPDALMLFINGANEGLLECLKEQKIIIGAGNPIEIGDEAFVVAIPSEPVRNDMILALAAMRGPLN